MANLIKLCKKYFGKKNLYEVFEIENNATEKDIKRAYHRLSLLIHPDRVPEDQKAEATEKFKVISAVHSVLSNKAKRESYDKTGSVDSEDCLDIENWKQYWQCVFKEITEQDIVNYEKKYKGSEEELEDLKKAYVNNDGDMNKILEYVLFSSPEDEARFDEILRKWIDSDEVPAFDKYLKEPKSRKENRRKKYEKERVLAEKIEKKRKKPDYDGSTDDLFLAIQSRQSSRAAAQNDFLQRLEQKYASTSSKTSTKKNTTKKNTAKRRKK